MEVLIIAWREPGCQPCLISFTLWRAHIPAVPTSCPPHFACLPPHLARLSSSVTPIRRKFWKHHSSFGKISGVQLPSGQNSQNIYALRGTPQHEKVAGQGMYSFHRWPSRLFWHDILCSRLFLLMLFLKWMWANNCVKRAWLSAMSDYLPFFSSLVGVGPLQTRARTEYIHRGGALQIEKTY